jgi:hypothetical protein
MYDLAAGKVRSALDGHFAGAGRYGSGSHQYAVGDTLNNLATQLYGSAYDANQNRALQAGFGLGNIAQGERQQQLGGIGLLPAIVSSQIANSSGLLAAGQYQDQHNLAGYWRPFDALQRYMSIVSGNGGGGAQVPSYAQAPSTDPMSQALAAGRLALDAYNTFAAKPDNSGYVTTPMGYGPAGMWNGGTGVNPTTGLSYGGV